jgi:hypothetical protein
MGLRIMVFVVGAVALVFGLHQPATAHAANRVVTELTGFTTPSGNVGCYIDTEMVRCDIRERDWAVPPRSPDCPEQVSYGQGLEIVNGDAVFVCAGDTALNPDADVVAYGDSISAGSLSCEVRFNGVNCSDGDSGHGFFLARESFDFY